MTERLTPVREVALRIEELLTELDAVRRELSQLRAALPRCHHTPCTNIGVKWISRTCLCCDTHGSIYLQDAPWAEYARSHGLAGRHSNIPDPAPPEIR